MKAKFFVGIGAAKAGTSWIAEYLSRHPEVAFSPVKELHFFDAMFCGPDSAHWNTRWSNILSELAGKYRESPSAELREKIRCVRLRLDMIDDFSLYRRYFDLLIGDEHRAFGEITPAYSLLPEPGFRSIIELYPDARFVFIMRDPVDRYLSQIQFSQSVRELESGFPIENFDPDARAIENLDNPAYTARGDYERTMRTLLRVTSGTNVLVLFYEHLFDKERSSGQLAELCDFLGISFQAADSSRRVNQSQPMRFDRPVVARIKDRFSSTYEYVTKNFGDSMPDSWRR